MRTLTLAALTAALTLLVAGPCPAGTDHGLLGVGDTDLVENIYQLTDNADDDWAQCWGSQPFSPDGQAIVFTAETGGAGADNAELYLIGVDGSGLTRLTENTTCDSHGSFTPDGARVVFQREDEATGYAQIMSMNLDGSGLLNLSQAHGGCGEACCEKKPMVSPDGTMVAFSTCSEQVFVMDIDGTNARLVSGGLDRCTKYVWSPDSAWVVFGAASPAADGNSRIFKAPPAADAQPVMVSPLAGENCHNWPAVSPDGQWVSYHVGNGTLRLVRLDGTMDQLLAAPGDLDSTFTNVCGPSDWSPNSLWVALKAGDSGETSIFVKNIQTGQVKRLTQGYRDQRHWFSPSGQGVLFRDNSSSGRDAGANGDDLLFARFKPDQVGLFTGQGAYYLSARRVHPPAYAPGRELNVNIQIDYSGPVDSLALAEIVPQGWVFAGVSGDDPPNVTPLRLIGPLEFAWTTTPASPVNFTYTLSVPEGFQGETGFEGQVRYALEGQDMTAGVPATTIEQQVFHSADYNPADLAISLGELLRGVQLYKAGAYHVDPAGEDGYNPGAGSTSGRPHSSDYNPQDWAVGFSELLRLVQFYGLGGYIQSDQGEDGFLPASGGERDAPAPAAWADIEYVDGRTRVTVRLEGLGAVSALGFVARAGVQAAFAGLSSPLAPLAAPVVGQAGPFEFAWLAPGTDGFEFSYELTGQVAPQDLEETLVVRAGGGEARLAVDQAATAPLAGGSGCFVSALAR